jgi:hypothetical protein
MEVIRVTTSERQTFTVYSSSFFGQNVHFFGNRSFECTKDKSACNGCERGWPVKWKGYLHCFDHMKRREVFVELTSAASEMMEALVDPDKPLRGVVVNISKTKGGRYGRYVVSLLSRDIDADKLPEEKDPYPVLKFLWACKNKSGQRVDQPVS